MVKVSIIIPVYNAEDFIVNSIESALNQTLQEVEIIAVNDGSTDGTLDILNRYEGLYHNVYVYSQTNQKQGAARNLGLSKAKGEYIYFLDADDYLDLDAMKICYNKMKENNLDLLTFDAYTFFEEGTEENLSLRQYVRAGLGIDTNKVWTGKEFFHLYWEKKGIFVTPWSMMLKHSFLVEEQVKFIPGIFFEDNIFALEVYQKAQKMQYTTEKLYNRRYRNNSVMVSNYTEFHLFSYFVVVREILNIVIKEMDNTVYSEDRIQFWMHSARRLFNVWEQSDSLSNSNCISEFVMLLDTLNQNYDLLVGRKEVSKIVMFMKKMQELALACWTDEEVIKACDRSQIVIEKMCRSELYLFSCFATVRESLNIVIKEIDETVHLDERMQDWIQSVRRLLNVWETADLSGSSNCINEFIILLDTLNENYDLLAARNEAGKIIMFIKKIQSQALACWKNTEVIEVCRRSQTALEKMYKQVLKKYIEDLNLDEEERIGFWGNNRLIKIFISLYIKQKGPFFSKIFYIQQSEEFEDKYWGDYVLNWQACKVEQLEKIYMVESGESETGFLEGFEIDICRLPSVIVECLESIAQKEESNSLDKLIDMLTEMIQIINSTKSFSKKRCAIERWITKISGINKMIEDEVEKHQESWDKVFELLEELLFEGIFTFVEEEAKRILFQIKKILYILEQNENYFDKTTGIAQLCSIWSQSINRYFRLTKEYGNLLHKNDVDLKINEFQMKMREEAQEKISQNINNKIEMISDSNIEMFKNIRKFLENIQILSQIELSDNGTVGFYGKNTIIKQLIVQYVRYVNPVCSQYYYISQNGDFNDPYWRDYKVNVYDLKPYALDVIYLLRDDKGLLSENVELQKESRIIVIPRKIIKYLQEEAEIPFLNREKILRKCRRENRKRCENV